MGNACIERQGDCQSDESRRQALQFYTGLWNEVQGTLADVSGFNEQCRQSFQMACKGNAMMSQPTLVEMTENFIRRLDCDNPRTSDSIHRLLDSTCIHGMVTEAAFTEFTRTVLTYIEQDLKEKVARCQGFPAGPVPAPQVLAGGLAGGLATTATTGRADYRDSRGGYDYDARARSGPSSVVVASSDRRYVAGGGSGAAPLGGALGASGGPSGAGVAYAYAAAPLPPGNDPRYQPGGYGSSVPFAGNGLLQPTPAYDDTRVLRQSVPSYAQPPPMAAFSPPPYEQQQQRSALAPADAPNPYRSSLRTLDQTFVNTTHPPPPSPLIAMPEEKEAVPRKGVDAWEGTPMPSSVTTASFSVASGSGVDAMMKEILAGNLRVKIYNQSLQLEEKRLALNNEKQLIAIFGDDGIPVASFPIADLLNITQGIPPSIMENPPPGHRSTAFQFKDRFLCVVFEDAETTKFALAGFARLCGVQIVPGDAE